MDDRGRPAMSMVRGVVYGLACLGLLVAGALLLPFWTTYADLFQRPVPAATWVVAGLSAAGLLLAAGLCVAGSLGRRVPALLPLAPPIAATLICTVVWVVGARAAPPIGRETGFMEALEALVRAGVAAAEVAAWGLPWAGLAFLGAALVAGSAAPPAERARRSRLRWLAVAAGLAGATGAAVAAILAVPWLRDSGPWSLELGPGLGVLSLLRFAAPSTTVALLGTALLPLLLLPVWIPLRGLPDREARRLAAARTVGAAGCAGAATTLTVAAWLRGGILQAGIVLADPGGMRSGPCGNDYATIIGAAVAPFVLGAGLLVAALLALGLGSRLRAALPAGLATLAAIGALVGGRALAAGALDRAAGGPCGADCTCAQVAAATLTGRRVETSRLLEPERRCCSELLGFDRRIDLPEVAGEEAFLMTTSIVVTREMIAVDDSRVVDLRDGIVDPANEHQGPAGPVVLPLLDALREKAAILSLIAARNPNFAFERTAVVEMTRAAPARLLDAVLLTAGEAGYAELRFGVRAPGVRDRCPYGAVAVRLPHLVGQGQ